MKKVLLNVMMLPMLFSHNAVAQLGMPSFDIVSLKVILSVKSCQIYHPELDEKLSESYRELVVRTGVDWPKNMKAVDGEEFKREFDKEPSKEICLKFIENIDNKLLDKFVIESYKIRTNKRWIKPSWLGASASYGGFEVGVVGISPGPEYSYGIIDASGTGN